MKVRLGNYIREYSKRNKQDSNIPVYSVTNSQGFVSEYFYKEVASKDKTTYKLVPKGYFAYNPSRINVGSVDFQRKEDCVIVSPLYVVFHVSDELDKNYLLYYLKSQPTLCQIKHVATGSVRDNLKFSYLADFSIELKPLDEQKTIAKTLQHIETLIALYKKQLAKLEELVKCRFFEMFIGKGYPRRELQSLIQDGTSISYGIVQPGDDGTGNIGLLRPVDFHNGSVVLDNLKYIGEAISNLSRKTILEGNELLITVRGTTGLTALTNSNHRGMNVTRGIAVVRYDGSKIVPEYLHAFMSSDESQTYIREHTRGATLQQINLSDLRIQSILVPPFVEQQTFADFVSLIDKLRFDVQAALDKAQTLFDSLMQEYFG